MVLLSLCAPGPPENLPGPQCGQSLTLGQRCRSLSAISCHYVPLLTCFASLRGYFPVALGSPWSQLACIRGSQTPGEGGKAWAGWEPMHSTRNHWILGHTELWGLQAVAWRRSGLPFTRAPPCQSPVFQFFKLMSSYVNALFLPYSLVNTACE